MKAALERVRRALEPLPTEEGGIAIVLATAGVPPALALLSSGDVLVSEEGSVRAALYGGTSAAQRLGGSFTILVPVGGGAARVEVVEASARSIGSLAVLEGVCADVRPTTEPPWALRMSFGPIGSRGIHEHVAYWRDVRNWLADGAASDAPAPPEQRQGR